MTTANVTFPVWPGTPYVTIFSKLMSKHPSSFLECLLPRLPSWAHDQGGRRIVDRPPQEAAGLSPANPYFPPTKTGINLTDKSMHLIDSASLGRPILSICRLSHRLVIFVRNFKSGCQPNRETDLTQLGR